jgi:hypothetical protein
MSKEKNEKRNGKDKSFVLAFQAFVYCARNSVVCHNTFPRHSDRDGALSHRILAMSPCEDPRRLWDKK